MKVFDRTSNREISVLAPNHDNILPGDILVGEDDSAYIVLSTQREQVSVQEYVEFLMESRCVIFEGLALSIAELNTALGAMGFKIVRK